MDKSNLTEMRGMSTKKLQEGTRSSDMLHRSQDFNTHSRHISDQPIPRTPKEYIDRINEKLEYLTSNEQRFFYLIKEHFTASREEGIFIRSFFNFLEKKMPEKMNDKELVNSLKEAWNNIIERENYIKVLADGLEELKQKFELKESIHLENQLEKVRHKAGDTTRQISDVSTIYHYKPLQITDKQISLIQDYIKRGDMKSKHILDTDVSIGRYNEMSYAFSNEQNLKTQINYAIKSQSNTYLLQDLMHNGLAREKQAGQSRFGMDAASAGEIEKCIYAAHTIGIDTREICSRITLSNPNMQPEDMVCALTNGVRSFVFHNLGKLKLLYANAENCHVKAEEVEIITRIPGPSDANKTGGNKFGADPKACEEMLLYAHDKGMKPTGMAVHIGWQVDSAEKMEKGMNYALGKMAQIFKNMEEHSIKLSIVDLGGGWPNQFRGQPVPSISENAAIVRELMDKHFGYLGSKKPALILEPGNYLSAAAGVTKANIINIDKIPNEPGMLRCALDAGMFNGGLVDGHYPVSMIIDGKPVEALVSASPRQRSQYPIVIFGPSCDSSDKISTDVILSDHPEISKRFRRMLKANNAAYDITKVIQKSHQHFIILHGTGAYTSEYNVGKVGERGFNSIPNPELVIISQGRVIETDDV